MGINGKISPGARPLDGLITSLSSAFAAVFQIPAGYIIDCPRRAAGADPDRGWYLDCDGSSAGSRAAVAGWGPLSVPVGTGSRSASAMVPATTKITALANQTIPNTHNIVDPLPPSAVPKMEF